MLPVLVYFTFDTIFAQVAGYIVAACAVAYTAWSGWRSAPEDRGPDGKLTPTSAASRRNQALLNGVIAAAIALFAISYAYPKGMNVPFFGATRGEGIPLYTYGLLIGLGFALALIAAAILAGREWPGALGRTRRAQVFDMGFVSFICGIIGARDLYVLVNFQDYLRSRSRAPEAYAVVLDLIVLCTLVVLVAGRARFFRDAVTRTRVVSGAFRAFIATVVGGRIGFALLFGAGGLRSMGDMLAGGMVFYGAVVGSVLAVAWYCITKGIRIPQFLDVTVPMISLGQAFGRLGCFAAGCCWGKAAPHLPWAVEFPGSTEVKTALGSHGPTASLSFSSMAERASDVWVSPSGAVTHAGTTGATRLAEWVVQHGHTIPIHPTQLYESVGQVVLFVALLWMRGYRRFYGQLTAMWLICYAFLRSTVELYRGDAERGTLHGFFAANGFTAFATLFPDDAWYNLSVGQFFSLVLGGAALWYLVRKFKALPKIEEFPAALPTPA